MYYNIKFPNRDKLEQFVSAYQLGDYSAEGNTLTLNTDKHNKAEMALKASHYGGIVWHHLI